MRTLLGGELAIALDEESQYLVKLEVQNGSGTWIDVGAALGRDWILNASWGEMVDSPVSHASFTLVQKTGNDSLAPLMSASVLNVDDDDAYSPLLELGRLVRMSVATMARGVALDVSKYRRMFDGRIDDVQMADAVEMLGPITIVCSDLGAWLMDLQIETTDVQYGTRPVGTDLEDVIQAVIDDNLPPGDPPVLLFKQSTSGFAVTDYVQGETKVMEALQTLVLDSVGEDIRYRYDAAHDSLLTWFNPDRSRVTVDATIPLGSFVLRELSLSLANIRNAGQMPFLDLETGASGTVTQENATSIANYRRRYVRLAANSMIGTEAEAQAVIDAVINDLSGAPEEAVADCPFMWFVQLFDRYTFPSNDRQFDDDQTLAVVGFEHVIEQGRGATAMTLTGRVLGAYAQWLRRVSPRLPEGAYAKIPVPDFTGLISYHREGSQAGQVPVALAKFATPLGDFFERMEYEIRQDGAPVTIVAGGRGAPTAAEHAGDRIPLGWGTTYSIKPVTVSTGGARNTDGDEYEVAVEPNPNASIDVIDSSAGPYSVTVIVAFGINTAYIALWWTERNAAWNSGDSAVNRMAQPWFIDREDPRVYVGDDGRPWIALSIPVHALQAYVLASIVSYNWVAIIGSVTHVTVRGAAAGSAPGSAPTVAFDSKTDTTMSYLVTPVAPYTIVRAFKNGVMTAQYDLSGGAQVLTFAGLQPGTSYSMSFKHLDNELEGPGSGPDVRSTLNGTLDAPLIKFVTPTPNGFSIVIGKGANNPVGTRYRYQVSDHGAGVWDDCTVIADDNPSVQLNVNQTDCLGYGSTVTRDFRVRAEATDWTDSAYSATKTQTSTITEPC